MANKQLEAQMKYTFGNDAHWTINKQLCKLIGFEATLLIQHFFDLQTKVFHGEFFQTHDQITEHLGFKRRKIEGAIQILKSAGLLIVTKKGLPQTSYYKVDLVNLTNFLTYGSSLELSPYKKRGLDPTKNTVL